ncbi:hypothetical protein GCM10022380_75710 [Amycolatopsis tucumanensis]|uniref:Uncharacterized protein n=1 Tax=Amycolatopsis tucumanensis TaxID=401106 RepID=A0ABP7JK54_9PSEU
MLRTGRGKVVEELFEHRRVVGQHDARRFAVRARGRFGVQPSRGTTATTCCFVRSDTRPESRSASDAVVLDTPAAFATATTISVR